MRLHFSGFMGPPVGATVQYGLKPLQERYVPHAEPGIWYLIKFTSSIKEHLHVRIVHNPCTLS